MASVSAVNPGAPMRGHPTLYDVGRWPAAYKRN